MHRGLRNRLLSKKVASLYYERLYTDDETSLHGTADVPRVKCWQVHRVFRVPKY